MFRCFFTSASTFGRLSLRFYIFKWTSTYSYRLLHIQALCRVAVLFVVDLCFLGQPSAESFFLSLLHDAVFVTKLQVLFRNVSHGSLHTHAYSVQYLFSHLWTMGLKGFYATGLPAQFLGFHQFIWLDHNVYVILELHLIFRLVSWTIF